jgi:hypothetical protein
VSPALPIQGTALFCYGTIPEVLAEAQLLHTVCERFTVFIEQRELDRIRNELREHAQQQETAAWLRMRLWGHFLRPWACCAIFSMISQHRCKTNYAVIPRSWPVSGSVRSAQP